MRDGPVHGGFDPSSLVGLAAVSHSLWVQAGEEHPDDLDARRRRYLELLRANGMVVPKDSDQPRTFPCGKEY
jgi:hypothetical protein